MYSKFLCSKVLFDGLPTFECQDNYQMYYKDTHSHSAIPILISGRIHVSCCWDFFWVIFYFISYWTWLFRYEIAMWEEKGCMLFIRKLPWSVSFRMHSNLTPSMIVKDGAFSAPFHTHSEYHRLLPVYLWGVPDRYFWGISQLPQSFVALIPTSLK